jgi:hypothetical protein
LVEGVEGDGEIEYAFLAVVALSILCFASWLQNEMDRAARVHDQSGVWGCMTIAWGRYRYIDKTRS